MAKGNALMGQLRGKAGDLVFSRLKGQQIVKARNRQPNNPRTNAQMRNRALFVGAVQFFSRALQAQFKFAFEGKKQKESDYNAFMRYNAKKGIYLKPEEIYDRSVACVGEFMMTKGSISQPDINWDSNTTDDAAALMVRTGDTTISTVADLANYLLPKYNLQNGDIFTMWVAQGAEYYNGEEWEIGDEPVNWKIAQVILDVNDSRTLAVATENQDAHIYACTMPGGTIKGIKLGASAATDFQDDSTVTIGGCCVTRVVDGAVKASTSYVQLNKAAKLWYTEHTSSAYVQEVLAAWEANGTPILKGGIAESNFPS